MAESNNQNVYIPDDHMYMYDLGWLVKAVLNCESELTKAIELRTIHYANPIEWNITTQYQANTVVVDANSGTAYISSQPVPSGVLLSDTKYWSVIFNYADAINKLMSNIASNERDNLIASNSYEVGDLVWYQSSLYRVIKAMAAADTFVVGTNIVAVTFADQLKHYIGLNRTANIGGTDTLTAGAYVLEVTGDGKLKATNYSIDVDGDYTINAGNASVTAADIVEHSTGDVFFQSDSTCTIKGKNLALDGEIAISGNASVNTTDFIINSTNPVTYRTPVSLGTNRYMAVPFIGADGATYQALVNADIKTYATLYDYGAVGDGVTDDTAAVQAAVEQTTYDTILVPPGKYHTTASIKCRDGIRIVGAGRNTCEFINSFSTGTFTLANNVFFESLNFETDNNADGVALYGDGVFAVNINHCDSLGGYFNKTKSRFIKMINGFHTLLLNDCIIDCGATTEYAIELLSNGDNSLNKDVQFRDVFCDTWYATTGGSIKLDSVYSAVFNNCIIRSHANCVYLDRTVGDGNSTLYSEYCFYDGDSDASNIQVNGMCEFFEYLSSYGLKVHFTNNGYMSAWDGAARLIKYWYGTNAYTAINADSSFMNARANGTFDIVKPATSDAVNISLYNQGLPTTAEWDISYCGGLITDTSAYSKNGMYLLNSDGSLLYYGMTFVDNVPHLVISTHVNAQTAGVEVKNSAWYLSDNIWLSINHRAAGWIFYVSIDGVSWVEFYRTALATYSPVAIGIAIDSGANNAVIANVKQWHIETY